MEDIILSMKNVTKSFPGVIALKDITLDVARGHIHGICGENGAGKSTLMKILSGVYHKDKGNITFDGQTFGDFNPKESQLAGISMVFQEFNLISTLSVAENIFLDRLTGRKGIVDWKAVNQQATNVLKRIGYQIDVTRTVNDLSVSERQMVEIAKAISYNSKLIVMDEPSSSLTSEELQTLFSVISDLRTLGITILYISHKLEEIFDLCDDVTVIRDGEVIVTKPIKEISKDEIIQNMVGRTIECEYPPRTCSIGVEVLKTENMGIKGKFSHLDISLHKGEILGLVGLVGSGRTELVRALFGADRIYSGKVFVNGHEVNVKEPNEGIREGLALLPEDRRNQGLFMNYSVKNNIPVTNLNRISKRIFVNTKQEMNIAQEYITKLMIKTPSVDEEVMYLSGGNQQKVVIAKWLFSDPDILFMDDPTRGIDVGAKYEIYLLMNQLVEIGKSIIFISSELPEILGMSDRVIVLGNGRRQAEFKREDFDPEIIMKFAIQ